MAIGYGANANRLPQNRIVEWGKYKGKPMREVPMSYLKWFVKHAFPQMVARRAWAEEEIKRREEKLIAMSHKRDTIVRQRRETLYAKNKQ